LLTFFLPGLGLDFREFEPILRSLAFNAEPYAHHWFEKTLGKKT
jgi:hypothetical protein